MTFAIRNKAYITGTNIALWEYNPVADVWTQKKDADATYGVAFSIGQKGYFFNSYAQMWEYDPLSNDLTLKSSFPGAPVCYPAGFSVEGKSYIGLGGLMIGNTCTLTTSSEFWEYSP